MIWLRSAAALLGLGLIAMALAQFWGVARPVVLWLPDVVTGGVLLAAALLAAAPGWQRRALLSATLALATGWLSAGVFAAVLAPHGIEPGHLRIGTLMLLRGTALVVALWGLVFSLLLPLPHGTNDQGKG